MSIFTNLNINYFLESSSNSDSEQILNELLSGFSCSINLDIENFLITNSISSAKKGQSATYLVLNQETKDLVGYFSLAVRPISVSTNAISKTTAKKLSRISDYDASTATHTLAAYLIAQLGKNLALPVEDRISGRELLTLATEQIMKIRNLAGGVVEFLECEDNQKLLKFYSDNGFVPFNHRMTKGTSPHKLHQLLKFI